MTNSISDILGDKFDEPDEITQIKSYVKKKYDDDVGVELRPDRIIIAAPNASLASTLRMELHKLQKDINTDKKLIIRIG